MPAPTLYQLAKKACIKNIKAITDIGDMPYDMLRPVLLKLENPDQLRQLEENSPQIIGHDSELWLQFIKRDVPGWENKAHKPKNPKNWYKIYRRLMNESQAEIDKDAANLKAAMESLRKEKAEHTSRVVDPSTVPKLGRTKKRTPGLQHGSPTTLTFGAGSRTKMTTGKSVLEKARREAKEMSLFSVRKAILATPTHRLGDRASTVQNAPRGLVDDHRKAPLPANLDGTREIPTVFAPRRRSSTTMTTTTTPTTVRGPAAMSDAEKERRLRALTMGSTGQRDMTSSHGSKTSSSKPSAETVRNSQPAMYRAPRLKLSGSGSHSRSVSPAMSSSHAPRSGGAPGPRPAGSPEPPVPVPMQRRKAEANPFMPAAKRRKV